jgi:tight adherence protein B
MWVVILVFAAITLLAYAVAVSVQDVVRYRVLVRERVEGLAESAKGDGNASLFKDLKQLDADLSRARTRWPQRMQEMLEQAGLRVTLKVLSLASLGCGTVVAAVSWIAFRHWWVAPLGMALGLSAPWAYVRLKCARRMRRLGLQLPEAFDAIGRAVRAGQTTTAAFQNVADESEPPLSDEFRRCYEEQNLGMPRETALRNLAARTGIMELRIFVVALLMQSRCGGNLTELLGNLSMLVRKRIKLQQKVKALTSEGRMQALVLIVLPIVAFAALNLFSPQYESSLLNRPWLLATALGAQLAGALWIRHTVNFPI